MKKIALICGCLCFTTVMLDAEIEPKPEGWIQDNAGVLDANRSESLQERMTQTHAATGVTVHVVTYESLSEPELASSRAAQLLEVWTDADHGGLLVYVENPPRLAVATTRTATMEDEEGTLRTIAQNGNTRLDAGGNPAQILRETALELDYLLRAIYDRQQTGFFVKYPLRILVMGAGALVAMLIAILATSQARHHNIFGRVLTFQERPAVQRLGGNRTGGHSAVRSF